MLTVDHQCAVDRHLGHLSAFIQPVAAQARPMQEEIDWKDEGGDNADDETEGFGDDDEEVQDDSWKCKVSPA